MKAIQILYTKFEKQLLEVLYSDYLKKLPRDLQDRNHRFVRWQDRHADLFGKLLLLEILDKNDFGNYSLKNIKYTKYKRPYFEGDYFDFNTWEKHKI